MKIRSTAALHSCALFFLKLLPLLVFLVPGLRLCAQTGKEKRDTIGQAQHDSLIQRRACMNGDLEFGNFMNWTGRTGNNNGSGIINYTGTGFVVDRHTIVPQGNDNFVPQIQRVFQGNYALKLGNTGATIAQSASYKFTVNTTDGMFRFYYALVMKDPGGTHSSNEKPFFRYMVGTTSGLYLTGKRIVANNADPLFKTHDGFVYKDWDCEKIDLSAFKGQELVIIFETANCSLGAGDHLSYAYIDALCSDCNRKIDFNLNAKYCNNEDIFVNFHDIKGATHYFFEIEESDANAGRPNPAGAESIWFAYGEQPGIFNTSNFYRTRGKKFECGRYYRIKIAIVNSCCGWTEEVKLIHIKCAPSVEAGPDICCGPGMQLGTGKGSSKISYTWTAGTNGSLNYLSTPGEGSTVVIFPGMVKPDFPQTYYLSATYDGCTSRDSVKIYCSKPDIRLALKNPESCCDKTIRFLSSNWNSIAEAQLFFSKNCDGLYDMVPLIGKLKDITIHGTSGCYMLVATNPCGRDTSFLTIQKKDMFQGEPGEIPVPPVCWGLTYSTPLTLHHFVGPSGLSPDQHYYNAYRYQLVVFDRWGGEHLVKERSDCKGLAQGEIQWDGKIGGVMVPNGTYNFKLRLYNCSYPDGKYSIVGRKPNPIASIPVIGWFYLLFGGAATVPSEVGCVVVVN